MSKLLLIDVSSVFYPAWHMRDGKDTNFPYQVTVERVRSLAHSADHVAVCCDCGPSFRNQISADYKANRPDKEPALIDQLRRAQETLERDGFHVVSAAGFEADDVIATFTAWARAQIPPHEVVIATADKDLSQLVGEGVTAYSLTKSVYLGVAEVSARFGGIRPDQIRDFLALVGDKSDNVRGIAGVGEKHAANLLNRYGSVNEIYSALIKDPESVATPSIRKALTDGVTELDKALKLVALRSDVPIDCSKILTPRLVKPLVDEEETSELSEQEDTLAADIVDAETGEVIQSSNNQAPEVIQAQPAPRAMSTSATTSPAADDTSVAPGSWTLALEPRSPGQAIALAAKLFNSRMFAGYGNPEAVLSTILLGRELGIGAMGSLRGIHNIKGKHALSADLMAALILQSGKAKYFTPVKLTKELATYKTHRIGSPEPVEMTFEFQEAVVAGLVKDDSGWKKWPLDMCKARVIARLARTVFPDVCFGLYVPEELEDADRMAA
jgi:5'-3' exonuclease